MPLTATLTRAAEFREMLGQRVWVADGAMGTMLQAKGAFINRCFDELNLSLPALVRDVHQEYIRAGAELIGTNTFGANRKRLAPFGFADKVRLINRAGVRIAREAARSGREEGDQAFVGAVIGPLGVRLEPLGSTTLDEARSIFREQIEALVEAGVDCLMLETFRDLNEVRAAVEAARDSAGPEMVLMAHLTVEDDGRLQDGTPVEDFTRALDALPVDVIGLNCSSGPSALLQAFERMCAFTNKPLSARPNAGLPALVDGRNTYLCSAEYLAQYAARFLQAGARIAGGCCGTTPEHIKAIREKVQGCTVGWEAVPERASVIAEPPSRLDLMEKVPAAAKSKLGAKLAAGEFVTLVEIQPPRGLDSSGEIAAARLGKDAGIDGIFVPDASRGGAQLSALVTCQLIEREAGIETVLQVACRDRSIPRVQSELMGAHMTGVRNLLCSAAFDIDAVGLATIVSNLNRGLDLGGNSMGAQTALLLGVDVNPGASNLDAELRRFEAKVKAGAEFAVTQPVFDMDVLEVFLKRAAEFGIPVIAGIRLLTSVLDAEFLINELRVPIPESYLERMRRAESLAIAREMVERVRPLVAGIQVSVPFGQYQMAIDVAKSMNRAIER